MKLTSTLRFYFESKSQFYLKLIEENPINLKLYLNRKLQT